MEIDAPGNFQAYFEALGQAVRLGSPVTHERMAQIQQQYDFVAASTGPLTPGGL